MKTRTFFQKQQQQQMNKKEQKKLNLNEINQKEPVFSDNIEQSKKIKSLRQLAEVIEYVTSLIMPFLTLRVFNSKKQNQIDDFCFGYYLQLFNLNEITIQSFGLEGIFVIPTPYQKASDQFSTFKIFYYMINLINQQNIQDKDIKVLIEDLRKQYQDVLLCWNNQMMLFLEQKDEDKNNMDGFISTMKKLFSDNYLVKLKHIFQILCAILKLIHVNDLNQSKPETKTENEVNQEVQQKEVKQKKDIGITYSQVFEISTNETDFDEEDENNLQMDLQDQGGSNQDRNSSQKEIPLEDQLQNIFQVLQGGELDENTKTQIRGLSKNYQGTVRAFRMNSNRIIGYAQFLYSTLIKFFFNDVGCACSNKAKEFSKDKQGEATFFRFSDKIIGGSRARPFLSNCYFVNLQRDLLNCWLETNKNCSEKSKTALRLVVENVEQLVKKNDQPSIREFFKDLISQQQNGKQQFSNNLLILIGHKSENSVANYTTIYELDNYCEVDKYDIDESDKKLLKTSTNQYLNQNGSNKDNQDNQESKPQNCSCVVSEILQNYANVQKIQNKVYIYEIGKQSLNEFLKKYINEIKGQQSQGRRITRLQHYNSNNHSEGTSPDDASNFERQIQQ
ncbi:unnamed protein product (macronuclear) [Paramecium tetraurelia]|uniref:Uncharacterized protein n=1 Tax=Paramecium tetraurelia TaxID=5888 RepID=A0D4R4_PARTE|nr:uncharacterized protein GSPATT00013478001 [Paramecium tetraurelia]CAK78031.1 unnamed protein product [Paramecium tetraurelia]|eukprot:XP_001445428.1 hypothetical protein (macronuclear) [Paramecium tetraurelia strain d4-2]